MAHPEMNLLFATALEIAKGVLEATQGELAPFAEVLAESGNMSHVSTPPEDKHAPEIIELLRHILRLIAAGGDCRAVAIVADTRASPSPQVLMQDAIGIFIEHATEDPVNCYVPYIHRGGAEFEYGETFATEGERHIIGFSP